ncbi:MAG: AIM24 family protein [Clostridia bacterium]|nr:AIM24 family protein [Clostridia bacterium]
MEIKNLQNEGRKIVKQMGSFSVLEYIKDLSVSPFNAASEYFMEKMGVRRRQVICSLKDSSIKMQAGALQWLTGNIQIETDVKGAGDFLGKMVKGAVTKESGVKPVYKGTGIVALEPTYKYLIPINVGEWEGGITIEDGMYLVSDQNIELNVVHRKNISSTVLGNEGFFNLSLAGNGIAVLESNVPENELIEINLNNGELKIDGRQAICWSTSLDFTVEKSTKSLIGSAISNEGFLNVYRGTGKVLMSPVAPTDSLAAATNTVSAKAADTASNVANAANIIGSFLGK